MVQDRGRRCHFLVVCFFGVVGGKNLLLLLRGLPLLQPLVIVALPEQRALPRPARAHTASIKTEMR
jgi:hypothetical protein